MKKLIVNNTILFLDIVNAYDIKIEIWEGGFYLNTIYYSLDQNILKYNFNDKKENIFFFTDKEKKKIKKECLKIFKKAYLKIPDQKHKTKIIDKIENYIKEA